MTVIEKGYTKKDEKKQSLINAIPLKNDLQLNFLTCFQTQHLLH